MVTKKDSNQARLKRHIRIRSKISGTAERPRLAVYRSNANISAQIIDDVKGVTLVAASTYGAGFTANGENGLTQNSKILQPARSASSLPRRRSHRVSPKSFSTEAAISITDVYRSWLRARARAA